MVLGANYARVEWLSSIILMKLSDSQINLFPVPRSDLVFESTDKRVSERFPCYMYSLHEAGVPNGYHASPAIFGSLVRSPLPQSFDRGLMTFLMTHC